MDVFYVNKYVNVDEKDKFLEEQNCQSSFKKKKKITITIKPCIYLFKYWVIVKSIYVEESLRQW